MRVYTAINGLSHICKKSGKNVLDIQRWQRNWEIARGSKPSLFLNKFYLADRISAEAEAVGHATRVRRSRSASQGQEGSRVVRVVYITTI